MIEQVKTAYRFLLVMGLGGLLLTLSLFVPVLSSSTDFSIYNTDWNGCSDLGRTVYGTGTFMPTIDISSSSRELIVHTSLPDLEGRLDPISSAMMVIGPDEPFTPEEGDFIHRFLMSGGRLLVADDFGEGNGLLSMLNTTTSLTGSKMLDLSFMRTGDFSVATDMAEHPLTDGVSMLLLNHPSTIIPGPHATALVNSSSASWLDLDGDYALGPDEPSGPFPLLTVEPYGKGELMVLSEPSILINQMQGRMNDSILVRNMVDHLTDGREDLVMDESHRDLTDPVQVMNVYVSSLDPRLKWGVVAASVVLFAVINTPFMSKGREVMERLLKRLLGGEAPPHRTVGSIFDEVQRTHPDWDARTLSRIRASIGERT